MTRRRWVVIAGGLLMLWFVPAFLYSADAAPSNDKAKSTDRVQQGKQPPKDDVQSRGLISKKKKKKKTDGGAAARSQPSERIDSASGNPADPAMP